MSGRLSSLLLVLVVVFSVSLSSCTSSSSSVSIHFMTAEKKATPEIDVEVATTEAQRELGLMYRRTLADNRGMLFVFEKEGERSFWMKNTYIELDMIFLDSELRVVSIIPRAMPFSERPRRSEGLAQYVLEVKGGSAEKWGVKKGDQAVIKGTLPGKPDEGS